MKGRWFRDPLKGLESGGVKMKINQKRLEMYMKNNNYYAVIFTSTQSEDIEGYNEMAKKMEKLAKKQKGFLGIESSRNELGITISYWETLEDIKHWKAQSDHLVAQQKGIEQWYDWYKVRICKVEREYEFLKNR